MHKLVIQCPDRPEQGAIFNIGMRCIIYWYVRICRVCVCARVDSLIKFAQSKHLFLADNKLLWRRDPSTQSCHDKNTLPITIGVPVPSSCIAPQDSLPIKLVIGETGNSLDRAAKVIFKRNGKKKKAEASGPANKVRNAGGHTDEKRQSFSWLPRARRSSGGSEVVSKARSSSREKLKTSPAFLDQPVR